ncbi:MAG: DUF5719 family protein [Trueperella sp.]|nr:DUF5719 family protein [Trueperella sp.]
MNPPDDDPLFAGGIPEEFIPQELATEPESEPEPVELELESEPESVDPEDSPTAKPSKTRRALRYTSKTLVALITAVAMLGVGIGIGYLFLREATVEYADLPPDPIMAESRSAQLVCTGGFSRAIAQGISVEDVDEAITGSAGALALRVTSLDAPASSADINATWVGPGRIDFSKVLPAAAYSQSGLGMPQLQGVLSITGDDAAAGLLAGSSIHQAGAGDLRGLAVNPCMWPTRSAWLVGSSAALGASNRLVLLNPTANVVQVEISAYSSLGPQKLSTRATVNLTPGKLQEVKLDGALGADDVIAINVSAKTGLFGAALESAVLEGYTPAGVSFITPAQFARKVVIPGLVIPAATTERTSVDLTDDTPQTVESELADYLTQVTLRIVNPAADIRTVDISVVAEDGTRALSGGGKIEVAPGSVIDMNLDGLKPGAYAVRVEADGEVTAGVAVRRTMPDHGTDVAWLSAQPQITRGMAAFGAADGELVISGTGKASWTAYDAAANEVASGEVTVADSSSGIALPAAAHYVTVVADHPVWAAVSLSSKLAAGESAAWVPITASPAEDLQVPVVVRN